VVDRSTLLNGCVSRLKEVRFVRSSSYGWFGSIDVRYSMFNRPFGK
jgi:hypothetical protein